MSKKRLTHWVIVLFLLAALPGMTAVMAQGQEPAAGPTLIEPGESAVVIPWQSTEVEPNNDIGQAQDWCDQDYPFLEECGRAHGGIISGANDIDVWRVHVPGLYFRDTPNLEWDMARRDNFPVLIDIEAQSMGSPLDAEICLVDENGLVAACSNDTDTKDPLLYYNFEVTNSQTPRHYYLKIMAKNGVGAGPNGKYQLLISTPYLFSAAAGGLGTGYVDGIPFQSGDILAFSMYRGGYKKWVLLFDLSDLNVKGNVTNLSSGWRNSDFLMLGFAAPTTVPGIGRAVSPYDVVIFDPSQVGPKTSGAFRLWWDGRQQGLTLAAEKPDAINWPTWTGHTRLDVSTTGAAKVYGGPATTLRLPDEDLGTWALSGDDEFYPRWGRAIDMSTISPAVIDVVAFSSTYYESGWYWGWTDDWSETWGFAVVQGTGFSQKNVMGFGQHCVDAGSEECDPPSMGLAWKGSDHGWNYNIDALQMQWTVLGVQ